jgi:ABC-type transport system involved in multi-copper enzyme maturation permease subunit
MKDALRYEVVRLRTLRSTWWLTAIALVIAGLLGLPALGVKGDATLTDYGDVVTGGGGGVFLVSIMLSILAIFATGHEYRYGTIRPTLSALPRRSALMTAKVLVVAGYVLVIAALCEVLRYVVSLIILGHRLSHLGLFPGPMARVWIGSIVYTAVYALVGLALAALFRNIPAAIVTVIVMPLVAENVVRGLLSLHVFHGIRGLAKLMPFSSGSQVFSYGPVDNNGAAGFNELPGPWGGFFIFAAFLAIVLTISWVLFERRDA